MSDFFKSSTLTPEAIDAEKRKRADDRKRAEAAKAAQARAAAKKAEDEKFRQQLDAELETKMGKKPNSQPVVKLSRGFGTPISTSSAPTGNAAPGCTPLKRF